MSTFSSSLRSLLSDFYRCPQLTADFNLAGDLRSGAGYFQLKDRFTVYGRLCGMQPPVAADATLPVVSAVISKEQRAVCLPFDPVQVAASLRLEGYKNDGEGGRASRNSLVRRLYYLLRPLMPVGVRKHLQAAALRGWDRIPFPHWPVDRTVDQLHEWLLSLAMRTEGKTEIPFIWFWPDGYSSCATVTHDIETGAGRDFCEQLMDLNDSYGIKSAFQVVPEERYEVPRAFLDSIRRRGFEVNIHDLNHDGRLFFLAHEEFLERVSKINRYGEQFQARGFRSAVLYRKQEWMHELDFDYDMSVPNVGHLDPQRGGCCTIMPFFMGDLLEIPVTVTQDYSLFNILHEYSTSLWEQQLAIISQGHGIANMIVHPDYIMEKRARKTYEQLLSILRDMRQNANVWVARAGDVCNWWKERSQMQLVWDGDAWRVEGKGSERARIAYARLDGDGIAYCIAENAKRLLAV